MKPLLHILPSLCLAATLVDCGPLPEVGIADPDQFQASATGPLVTSTRSAA